MEQKRPKPPIAILAQNARVFSRSGRAWERGGPRADSHIRPWLWRRECAHRRRRERDHRTPLRKLARGGSLQHLGDPDRSQVGHRARSPCSVADRAPRGTGAVWLDEKVLQGKPLASSPSVSWFQLWRPRGSFNRCRSPAGQEAKSESRAARLSGVGPVACVLAEVCGVGRAAAT